MRFFKHLGKSIEKTIRLAKVNILLRRRYGTRWPETVRYPDAEFNLTINPNDWRAIKKIAFDFARGRVDRNIQFWRDFVNHNVPSVCLDIGANYGECLYSLAYNVTTDVIAIEANTRLIPCLTKSRDAHPSRDRIIIHNVAAADSTKDSIPLFINTAWSGGTTALDKADHNASIETIHVPQRMIDDLISIQRTSAGPLVFKLDVEGYEPFVLKGMSKTIAAAPLMIGYIEVDTDFLSAASVSLDALGELLHDFDLYWPTDKRSKRLRPVASLTELQSILGKNFHTDIIVVKGGKNDHSWLPPSWTMVAS